MAPFDQDRKYALADLAMALTHDIRIRLMQLHMEDPGRSLSAAALQADLASEERFRDVTISQVQYSRLPPPACRAAAEQMTTQKRRPPRDDEEAAAFKGLGRAITTIRERRSLGRDELASRCEITRVDLEKLERGSIDESWGGLRHIAKALGVSLPALLNEAEKLSKGASGVQRAKGSVDGEY